ncbi:shikimate kinase [Ancylomarina longa]|uniref:Shikimate kinase n=1 Tax=Ancylomarina longa TaxID=2487017 RepID=A0A434AY24_9BACT|nr:shikimate kinase [Ancylomarina longa]RUT79339.1 shikimate kinase [Ancylomarina longa]
MRIFLIGYMGCGKSRWGRLIADHYGFRFIDLDSLIEEREKASIPELFENIGESGFREKEQAALHSIADYQNIIVATGGGAPCFNNNMEEMNGMGLTLYIEGSPELLRDRVTSSKTERPLVKNLSQEELLQYIQRHLMIRLPFYEQANYKIVSGNLELQDFFKILDKVIL